MTERLWTLEGALPVLKRIADVAREHGFTVALYGSVLTQGQSNNDLDLYLIVAEEQTTGVHALDCVAALAKVLVDAKCQQLTTNCVRIEFRDGKNIDAQFLDYAPLY